MASLRVASGSILVLCVFLAWPPATRTVELPNPLDAASDAAYTGLGLGPCSLLAPPGSSPILRYIPPANASRRTEDPPGVNLPVTAFSLGATPCNLVPSLVLTVDDQQPPSIERLGTSAFGIEVSDLQKSPDLVYMVISLNENRSAGPNCASPLDASGASGGSVTILDTVHFMMDKAVPYQGPDPRLRITFEPGVAYTSSRMDIDVADGSNTFCLFRALRGVDGGDGSSSTGSAGSGGSDDSGGGLGAGAIVAIVAGILIVVAVAAALVVIIPRRDEPRWGIRLSREEPPTMLQPGQLPDRE